MNVTIDLMNACADASTPEASDFQHWTEATLDAVAASGHHLPDSLELSIRVVDETESAALNETWRHKQGPTNILSFPFAGFQGTDVNLLGDLAICAPLVAREAAEQDKTETAHWAHLTVHGVLHLNGYDHEEDHKALQMETLETSILQGLGYPDPYHQDIPGNE